MVALILSKFFKFFCKIACVSSGRLHAVPKCIPVDSTSIRQCTYTRLSTLQQWEVVVISVYSYKTSVLSYNNVIMTLICHITKQSNLILRYGRSPYFLQNLVISIYRHVCEHLENVCQKLANYTY